MHLNDQVLLSCLVESEGKTLRLPRTFECSLFLFFPLPPLSKPSRFSLMSLLDSSSYSTMDTIELSDGSDSELSPQIVRSKSAKQQRPTPPVPVESSSGSKRRTVNDVAPFRASSCELQPISSRNNSNSGFRTSSDFLPIPVGTTSQTDENPRRTSTKRFVLSIHLKLIFFEN